MLAILSLLTIYTYFRHEIKTPWEVSSRIGSLPKGSKSNTASLPNLVEVLDTILQDYSPASTGSITGGKTSGARTAAWPADEGQELLDVLQISPKQILAMRDAHSGFVQAIDDTIPECISPDTKESPSRGIVTVGGGKYFPSLMVSLRLLRRTGSEYPVEVFVPEDEYEPELCRHYMPQFNAVCRTFPHMNHTISQYQFKTFAILFSSFSEVLWLDADNFPLQDVAPLFESRPFRETGLVTWPDLWQTTISPAYYLISSQEAEAVADRASTESGQLLVSKEKHWKTLLLAAYYNYYGPGQYYTLLCQGGSGIGDKETFVPAAEAMGLPFYQVNTPPQGLGHYKNNQVAGMGIHTFALLQYDPIFDYQVTAKLEEKRRAAIKRGENETAVPTDDDDDAAAADSMETYEEVPPFFLHMSTPKWDAKHVFDHVGEYDFTWDKSHKAAAAYRDPPETASQIEGVERMVWEETRWVACHLENVIGWWEGKRGDICTRIEEYFEKVLDTEAGEKLGLAGDLAPKPYIP